jgi:hypothetical protein
MQVLNARCPKCGTIYPSDTLESLSSHVCQYCGASLIAIYRGGSYFHMHRSQRLEKPEIVQKPEVPEIETTSSNLSEPEPTEPQNSEVELGPDLECVCPDCGAHYPSSLISPQHHQFCLRCGCDLELRQNGIIVRASCPGLKAQKYSCNLHLPSWENLLTKNLSQYMTMN